jgi:two-component system, OmpR family, response regulator VicR
MSRRKKKLLIVEDERDLVDTLAVRLRAGGEFEVETAYDGLAGLAKCVAFQPDVVLLDLSMPKMDGWEFCRALREDLKIEDLPVVVATAFMFEDTKKKAARWGVARLVGKPFEERELVDALSSLAAEARC